MLQHGVQDLSKAVYTFMKINEMDEVYLTEDLLPNEDDDWDMVCSAMLKAASDSEASGLILPSPCFTFVA